MFIRETFSICSGDYQRAGEASAAIKYKLKQLGIGGAILRRVAVAAYEAEMNLVIHSLGGTLSLEVEPTYLWLFSQDTGPGIPDVDKAMQEGYSTANEEARNLGFGAGMGLPNIKRNTNQFDIKSQPGIGTSIRMGFDLKET